MVNSKHRIRSELIADREKNPKHIEKAMSEKWGFFRPVSAESADEMSAVLDITEVEIKKYLKKKKQKTVSIEQQKDFGVTFVRRNEVGKKLYHAVANGFRMAHAIDDLGQSSKQIQEQLEVPLDWEKFAWFQNLHTKSVARFADSVEMDRLFREQEVIATILGEHGLRNVVSKPDHISLLTYGKPKERLGLTPIHKKAVTKIIRDTFEEEGLESVLLDPLNVGPSYTKPCERWENICT